MRNTTKLKQILFLYHLDLSMNDEGVMVMNMFHKIHQTVITVEDVSYSKLIAKAFSSMKKELKQS